MSQEERQAIGQRLVAERKAIAAGISASRASTFKRDLNALESSPRRTVSLSQREARGTRPPTVGRGNYVAPPKTGGIGGGIASPLTEQSYAEREWYMAKTLKSSDGLLTFQVQAIKQVRTTDADDVEVIMIYKEPTP